MIETLNDLRGLDIFGVLCRIALAMICGGLIGFERERRHRPAGFRTHILICLGAAMASAVNQYLGIVLHYGTDITRMGAQVIAGVSFIGAGAIIMTKRHQVHGLTTAAGLWVSAIIGLCCGSGFYEGAVCATAMVLIAEIALSELEHRLIRGVLDMKIYAEYTEPVTEERLMRCISSVSARIIDSQIFDGDDGSMALITVRRHRGISRQAILDELAKLDGIIAAEEA